MKILHIAAHMGGGIGSAYSGLSSQGLDQRIVLLEEPIDKRSLESVRSSGFEIEICPDREKMYQLLSDTDIVLFNWTHHPALTKFMYEFPDIAIRSMVWVHVSGNYFPAIKSGFLQLFDQCLFATPYALQLPAVKGFGDEYAKNHFAVVYGLGDLKRFLKVQKNQHEGINIGYVGTLNPCKIHPDYMNFAEEAINVTSNAKFLLAGDLSEKDKLKAPKHAIADKIEFLGRVGDVPALLSNIDIFAYILNPQHYGATENALLEAMAAGVPVVALNQSVEKIIIKNNVTGLLVDNIESFGNAVKSLCEDKSLREYLSENAKEYIANNYKIEDNRARMLQRYNVCMASDKKKINFAKYLGDSPAEWFLSGVEDDRECFIENRVKDAGLIFAERTKGSPAHYSTYFPEDERLTLWK